MLCWPERLSVLRSIDSSPCLDGIVRLFSGKFQVVPPFPRGFRSSGDFTSGMER